MRTISLAMIAIAASVATAGLVDAAGLSKTYAYFSIGGVTLDEIQNELSLRGPHVASTGARHPGATRMEFASRIGYGETPSGCRITSATVTVKAKVILPRWRRSDKAESDVSFIWSVLESDIKRHEESHVVIAKNHARMLEDELLKLGWQRNCEEAKQAAEKVNQKVLAIHDREQQRFDRVEGRNFESRLLRLLKYRLEQAGDRARGYPLPYGDSR